MGIDEKFKFDLLTELTGDEILVNWLQWVEFKDQLTTWRVENADKCLVVQIESDLSIDDEHFSSLTHADEIVINIESFVDGRIFSLSRVIRDNLKFSGKIRARGDYLSDQVQFLRRCGIDVIENSQTLDQSIQYFTEFYQPSSTIQKDEILINEARNKN